MNTTTKFNTLVVTDELGRFWLLRDTAQDWLDKILLGIYDLGPYPRLCRLVRFLEDAGFELEPRYPDDYPDRFSWIDARREVRFFEVCKLPPDIFIRGESEIPNPDRIPKPVSGFTGSLDGYLRSRLLVVDEAEDDSPDGLQEDAFPVDISLEDMAPEDMTLVLAREEIQRIHRELQWL